MTVWRFLSLRAISPGMSALETRRAREPGGKRTTPTGKSRRERHADSSSAARTLAGGGSSTRCGGAVRARSERWSRPGCTLGAGSQQAKLTEGGAGEGVELALRRLLRAGTWEPRARGTGGAESRAGSAGVDEGPSGRDRREPRRQTRAEPRAGERRSRGGQGASGRAGGQADHGRQRLPPPATAAGRSGGSLAGRSRGLYPLLLCEEGNEVRAAAAAAAGRGEGRSGGAAHLVPL